MSSKRSGRRGRGSSGGQLAVAAVAGLVLIAVARHSSVSAPGPGAGNATQMSTAWPNVALGKQLAAAYSWGDGGQWSCLDALWTRESDWSATAVNPTSDARGIAQDINGWSAGYPDDNASRQIRWGLAYIRARYGSPCAAWAHETSAGWY